MAVKASIDPGQRPGAMTLAKLCPTSSSRSPAEEALDRRCRARPRAARCRSAPAGRSSARPSPRTPRGRARPPGSARCGCRTGRRCGAGGIPGWSSAGRTSPPAATMRWHTTSRSSTTSAGWALVAGRKSASTPRWRRTDGPSNQQPPGSGGSGGLGTRSGPARRRRSPRRPARPPRRAASPAARGRCRAAAAAAGRRPGWVTLRACADDVQGAARLEPLDLLVAHGVGGLEVDVAPSGLWIEARTGTSGARSARPRTLIVSSSPMAS